MYTCINTSRHMYVCRYLISIHLLWHINSGELHELPELCILVVSEEGQNRKDPVGVDQDLQLPQSCNLDLLDVLRQHLVDIAAKVRELSSPFIQFRIGH